MKGIAERAVVFAVVVLLGGCATAYQSKSFTGGFSETDLGPTSFKIGFSGNGFTSAERASDFAMLRAADKSIEDGCNYFGVVSDAEGGSTSSFTVGSATYGRGSVFATSSTVPIFKPNSTLLVKCFVAQPPGSELFDAHYIAHSIRAKYRMPDATVPQAAAVTSQSATKVVDAPMVAGATPVVPVAPATNIAQQVLAAQRVASGQGCGDVSAMADGTFQASCSEGTIVVECDGDSCRPIRMKSR